MVFDQTCSQPDESVFILGSEEINVCLILQFEYKFLVDIYHRPNKAIRRKIDVLLQLMTLKEPTRLYIDHILKRQT